MVCDLWGHRQQFGGGDSNFASVVEELEDMDLSALCAMDRASLWASSNQEAYGDGSSDDFSPEEDGGHVEIVRMRSTWMGLE